MRMEVGGKDPIFLNLEPKWGECSVPRSGRFNPVEETVCSHCIWDWLRLIIGLGCVI